MEIHYSPLLSAPAIAALQARERFVRTALRALPADGAFRWTTYPLPDGSDGYVLRHTDAADRCLVWLSLNDLQRKLTETRITTLIAGRTRTCPGKDTPVPPCA
jgi:hypothetical protein